MHHASYVVMAVVYDTNQMCPILPAVISDTKQMRYNIPAVIRDTKKCAATTYPQL